MIWWFERGTETATCAVVRKPTHFEVTLKLAEGHDTIDIVHGATDLLKHIEQLPQRLLSDGWRARRVDLLEMLHTSAAAARQAAGAAKQSSMESA
jgi:hypothetical protein